VTTSGSSTYEVQLQTRLAIVGSAEVAAKLTAKENYDQGFPTGHECADEGRSVRHLTALCRLLVLLRVSEKCLPKLTVFYGAENCSGIHATRNINCAIPTTAVLLGTGTSAVCTLSAHAGLEHERWRNSII
jgi:hypothetical protein